MTTTLDPSTNGHTGEEEAAATSVGAAGSAGSSLARLRQRPENAHVLRGYGPLVVGAILFVLMVVLAPTVAPERVVEQPAAEATAP